MDRRCGRHSLAEPAQAAVDGQAGCPAPAGSAGGKPVSAHLGAEYGRAGLAPAAEAPAYVSADAHPGEEPVAAHCLEPGLAEEEPAVEPGRATVAEAAGTGAVD